MNGRPHFGDNDADVIDVFERVVRHTCAKCHGTGTKARLLPIGPPSATTRGYAGSVRQCDACAGLGTVYATEVIECSPE